MIIAAVLDGYSSSSRGTKIHDIVKECLDESEMYYKLIWRKSRFMKSNSRNLLKEIEAHELYSNTLLCVGKSLGAKHMVKRVLNGVGSLFYADVRLVTVDPNWPTIWDLTPNLNKKILHLKYDVSQATNVYVRGKTSRQQCGAMLSGPNVTNVPVDDADHFTIVEHPETKKAIRNAIGELSCFHWA